MTGFFCSRSGCGRGVIARYRAWSARYTDRVMSPQTSEIAERDRQLTPAANGDRPDGRGPSAQFLAGLTAATAAVVAGALFAEPSQITVHAPWVATGVLAFVLLLVSLIGFAAAAWSTQHRRRTLRIAGVSGVAGLLVVAVTIAVRLFVPLPLQTVLIQFSDLEGRVQIEYCPTLPQSFSASTTAADLHGTAAVLPVKVSGDVCGSEEFPGGIWLYLARSSVTVGGQ